jgi:ribonuclease BN (tRNA processing enzyme)
VRLVLLGVRGSTPAPGAAYLRYGGHTSSVAVLAEADAVPRLVLDGGTGVRDLTDLMAGQPFRGALVLSHLHWDHVYGLPFSRALDVDGAQIEVWVPAVGGDCGPTPDHAIDHAIDHAAESDDVARHLIAATMSPPHFPIGPDGLLGRWRFRLARPGRLPIAAAPEEVSPTVVRVAPVRHKGGTTWAVRVDLDGTSVGYVPDHAITTLENGRLVEPADDDVAALDLLQGVDLLLHDGQFTAAQARLAADYGHSTIEDALAWADRCQAGRLVLIHHAPTRTDDELDALAARWTRTPAGRPVSFGRQGDVLPVEGPGEPCLITEKTLV